MTGGAATRAPIDLDPRRSARTSRTLRWIRRGAGWLHLLLATAVVVAVFVQVYLIGAYVFGAGSAALDAHKTVGFTAHGFEVLVFAAALVAWLPRADLGLSLLLAAVGTVQVMLASEQRWVGALHPLFALVVLVLGAALARRAARRHRRASPAAT